jgi:polyribonucleotide nucleotidyltransferase
VPAPAAAGEAADAEPAALAAPEVDAAAVAAQCRYYAAAANYEANVDEKRENKLKELKDEAYANVQSAKYDAVAAEYEANVDEKREDKLKELKDEAYANLQSANEYLALTFRSISDAPMSSSRKLESQEVTIPAGVRKRQKLGTLRSCLVGV